VSKKKQQDDADLLQLVKRLAEEAAERDRTRALPERCSLSELLIEPYYDVGCGVTILPDGRQIRRD
jgi:hypothetical protein